MSAPYSDQILRSEKNRIKEFHVFAPGSDGSRRSVRSVVFDIAEEACCGICTGQPGEETCQQSMFNFVARHTAKKPGCDPDFVISGGTSKSKRGFQSSQIVLNDLDTQELHLFDASWFVPTLAWILLLSLLLL